MIWRRSQHLIVVTALAIATVLGALAAPEVTPPAPSPPTAPSPGRVALATPGATPAADAGDLYDAILPDRRAAIAAATAATLPRYSIEATLTPPTDGELPTVSGTIELRYVNTTGAPIDELPFRLLPNLRQYESGRMTIEDVTVDGTAVTPAAPPLHAVPAGTPVATPAVANADLILVRVPLPTPLGPGKATTVAMTFTTAVPIAPPDDSGLFRYHLDRGSWTLSGWYPMLAGYDPELGWDLDPPAAWSDVAFGAAALYDVTLSAPDDLVLVTPGIETSEETSNGMESRRFLSGPARELAIVADPTLTETSADVDGTTVTVYAAPDGAAGAEQVLGWATQALDVYGNLFGPYPYTTLDIVAVPDVLGAEFSEMIWLGEGYVADPEGSASRPGATELLVAHEVAHQWWYGLVGSDPHRRAFLDEGLAEYSAILYVEQVHGKDAARTQLDQALTLPYATMLVTSGDQVVDQPATAFPDATTYYATTYRKAGLGYAAIRAEIGHDAFFAALRRYVEANRFGIATPTDLLDAFEAASERDLDATWHLWFETASGRVRIIMETEGGTPVAAPTG
jgi:hypothetical protein